MKIVLTTITALSILLFSTSSPAQDKTKAERNAERDRISRISQSRPVRLDGPLRLENISDEEIREVQAVTKEHFPGAIVNIGGVTADCPCEDGLSCDSQVWVVAHRANRSDDLMLSKIGGHWTIGPLQKWWLRYDRLRSMMNAALANRNSDGWETFRKLQEQQNSLYLEFPTCDAEL